MTEQQVDAMIKCLDRLEKEAYQRKHGSYWWKISWNVLVALLVVSLLLGTTRVKVIEEIRVKRLVVVDKTGNVIAELSEKSEGQPIFELRNSSPGFKNYHLSLSPMGLHLGAKDLQGSYILLGFSLYLDERQMIIPRPAFLMTEDGKSRFSFVINEDQSTKLSLHDKTGGGATIRTGSITGLTLYDSMGSTRVGLSVSDHQAGLFLSDKPATPGGNPKNLASFILADGQSLLSFIRDGKHIWSVP